METTLKVMWKTCGKAVERGVENRRGVWIGRGGENYHGLSTQKLTDIRVVFRNYLLTLHVVNSVLITWLNR